MKNLIVENIYNNGRSVANQFEIYYEENNRQYKIFQSYESMILKWENGTIIEVGKNWDYSRTTGKYRNLLTDMNKIQFEKILIQFEKILKNEFEWNKNTQSYLRKTGGVKN